jgi:Taurine catabolism dioxygenase TauD, TfdA family
MITTQEVSKARADNAWFALDLDQNKSWILRLDDADRVDMLNALRKASALRKPLLEYRKEDFPFGQSLTPIRCALDEAQHGRGVALVKGLPRENVSEEDFRLLTWAIGLHFGVARPQDKATRYINEVRDAGVDYRSPTGRGYSSNSELDFHVDGADVVMLSCYNQAPVGGDSMCSSSLAAYEQLVAERPDLARVLHQTAAFSLQGEQAEGMSAFVHMPVYGMRDGRVFCMWVRNRIMFGEKLEGAPKLTDLQREAMELLDNIVRRPEFMYSMRLEAGDMQILSNHTALHSRTEFQDAPDPEKKRLLYRLWLSTPDAPALPPAWSAYYGDTEAGLVRGGARGQHYTDVCRKFDKDQATAMGMRLSS